MGRGADDHAEPIVLHGTTIDCDGHGVLIVGASGSGKSGLALQLMALGASLVADDQTRIELVNSHFIARAPQPITGLIEARGIGLLHARNKPSTRLSLAIDMDKIEGQRMPPKRVYHRGFLKLPCLHKVEAPYFPFAILQYLRFGRQEPA